MCGINIDVSSHKVRVPGLHQALPFLQFMVLSSAFYLTIALHLNMSAC